jgi:hypothetical protein
MVKRSRYQHSEQKNASLGTSADVPSLVERTAQMNNTEKEKASIELPQVLIKDLVNLVDYSYSVECRDYEERREAGEPTEGHIFESIKRLSDWLESLKSFSLPNNLGNEMNDIEKDLNIARATVLKSMANQLTGVENDLQKIREIYGRYVEHMDPEDAHNIELKCRNIMMKASEIVAFVKGQI